MEYEHMDATQKFAFARWVRWIFLSGFYMLSAAIWLVSVLVGLETFERGRSCIAEHHYKEYCNEQQRRGYRMVSQEELLKSQAQLSPSSQDNLFASTAAAPPALPAEDMEKAREAYAGQSEENLNVILALQGDLRLEFDREGNFIASHGDPELENFLAPLLRAKIQVPPFPGWSEAFAAVKTATAPVTMDGEVRKNGEQGLRFFYKITVTPLAAPDGSIGRCQMLFHDVSAQMPPDRRAGGLKMDPDSPWAVASYSYKKNWSRPDTTFSYNNFGFRGEDIAAPKPDGVFRIVCIGGSTTEEGNSNDRTYPHMLQAKLRAWLGTDRIEVLNCGIVGATSNTERQRMPDFLALQPDLILHYNGVNDICFGGFTVWQENAGRLQALLGKSKFMTRYFNRWHLPSDERIAKYLRATILRNIKAMHYAAREKGADMACCSFAYPTVSRWDFRNRNYLDINMRTCWHGGMVNFDAYRQIMSLYNRLLKETCEREGIHYVPVAENLVAGMDHFSDVCHMTATGLNLKSDIIGACVKDYVRQRLADKSP
jgi:lysophospholipase L1-like esterase